MRTKLKLSITTNYHKQASMSTTTKKLKFAHPGQLLLAEFIKPMDLTVYRVAKDSGIPQSTLQTIVSGKRSITAETAFRLGLYFNIDAQFWLNLQTRYDLSLVEDHRAKIEKEVHPLPKAA